MHAVFFVHRCCYGGKKNTCVFCGFLVHNLSTAVSIVIVIVVIVIVVIVIVIVVIVVIVIVVIDR